ncbi:MAG: rhomboid family intramembrane serine protease [Sphingomonas sp.]|uniref:rhomboid family intramembrane serine protease n=1 Tax=Sphingomonas sp. TaxID=28214 RepID=UPI001855CDAA|nr:rhomboid family intramembrane serine protease [Sphingomonas sp.]MBA3667805.1 rhomboid family intramembrane serine protease [Sphingomonas sp.]
MDSRRFGASAIIGLITIAVSVMALVVNLEQFVGAMGFIPARLSGADLLSPAIPAFLTPFSSALIHGSWVHLIINMVMLMIVGPQVERVIGMSGLIVAYLVGAVAAAAAQFAADPSSAVPMVGASGAISALFGLYAIFYGRPQQFSANMKINRWIHVAWLLITWIVIQMMSAALAGGQGVLLATPAHIGGFIAGLLMHRPLLLWRYRRA